MRLGAQTAGPPLSDLLTPHCVVESLLFEQISVTAGFNDLSVLEHKYGISVHDGRESMRDQDRDSFAPSRDVPNCATHFLFGNRVEGRRRLVEDE